MNCKKCYWYNNEPMTEKGLCMLYGHYVYRDDNETCIDYLTKDKYR